MRDKDSERQRDQNIAEYRIVGSRYRRRHFANLESALISTFPIPITFITFMTYILDLLSRSARPRGRI